MRPRLLWPMPTSNRAFPIERIDRLLGHRDHSPVLHGVVGIAAHLASSRQEDASLGQMVRAIGRRSTPRTTTKSTAAGMPHRQEPGGLTAGDPPATDGRRTTHEHRDDNGARVDLHQPAPRPAQQGCVRMTGHDDEEHEFSKAEVPGAVPDSAYRVHVTDERSVTISGPDALRYVRRSADVARGARVHEGVRRSATRGSGPQRSPGQPGAYDPRRGGGVVSRPRLTGSAGRRARRPHPVHPIWPMAGGRCEGGDETDAGLHNPFGVCAACGTIQAGGTHAHQHRRQDLLLDA